MYRDDSAEGEFLWKFDDTTYRASFHHDILRGNIHIQTQFKVFGVEYLGEVRLMAGSVEKELLIDIKGPKRVYVTVKYVSDLTKLTLKGIYFRRNLHIS